VHSKQEKLMHYLCSVAVLCSGSSVSQQAVLATSTPFADNDARHAADSHRRLNGDAGIVARDCLMVDDECTRSL